MSTVSSLHHPPASTELYTLSLHDALPIYVLTLDDVLSGRDFPDAIARGAYPVDLHDMNAGVDVLGSTVGGGGVTLRKIERAYRSEEHTSELQSQFHLVCRLLLEKKKEK